MTRHRAARRPADRHRSVLAVLLAFAAVLVGGVAIAANSDTPPCTDATPDCRDQRLASLESAVNSLEARLDATEATATSPSPSPTTTGAPGTCTNPIFTTSDPQGTINTDPGDLPAPEYWWINNDAWSGSRGPQTLQVCSEQSWNAISNQPNVGGQVETYPDTEFDVGGRTFGTTKTIDQYTSITSTYSEQFPTSGSMDAAYDLWLNNWSTEVMVWNEDSGTQKHWDTCTGCGESDVAVAGVDYRFVNMGDEFVFIRKTQNKAGSVDLLALFRYLQGKGLVKGTDVPTQLEYGVEICSTSGTQTFPLTGLTFSLA
jgi:hypothetical protein